MAYRLIVLPSAEADLEKLDPEPRRRILRRLVWLGEQADTYITSSNKRHGIVGAVQLDCPFGNASRVQCQNVKARVP